MDEVIFDRQRPLTIVTVKCVCERLNHARELEWNAKSIVRTDVKRESLVDEGLDIESQCWGYV